MTPSSSAAKSLAGRLAMVRRSGYTCDMASLLWCKQSRSYATFVSIPGLKSPIFGTTSLVTNVRKSASDFNTTMLSEAGTNAFCKPEYRLMWGW
jgi:hypothetical protein